MTSKTNTFTIEEVKEKDFIIIDNNVYDFKSFEEKHPGGAKVLVYFRGKNATEKFYKIETHTEEIKQQLIDFKVGEVKQSFSVLDMGNTESSDAHNLIILQSLNDEQLSKIKNLRDVIPEESKIRWGVLNEDMTLYRFLQARKWVVEDAWEMLEAHLNWRRETYPIKKSRWVNDPFFKAGSCIIGSGLDSGERPIVVMKSGRFPVAERNLEDCIAGFVALMTEMINIYGTHTRFTVLYDRQDFVKKDNLDLDLLKGIAKVLSDNMPETMERACVYPCGVILRGLWQIVKWFFDPVTRSKISMLGSPEAFKDYIPNEQLMDDMGGSSGFIWNSNDVSKWEEFSSRLPDETVDNWLTSKENRKIIKSKML